MLHEIAIQCGVGRIEESSCCVLDSVEMREHLAESITLFVLAASFILCHWLRYESFNCTSYAADKFTVICILKRTNEVII